MPPSASSPSRVEALDLLRLVAVLGVVLYCFELRGPPRMGCRRWRCPGWLVAKYGFLRRAWLFRHQRFRDRLFRRGPDGHRLRRPACWIYPTFVFCMTLTFWRSCCWAAALRRRFRPWLANLFIAARRSASYMELLLVAGDRGDVLCLGRGLIAAGLFRAGSIPSPVWLGITFANELASSGAGRKRSHGL